MTDKTNKPEDKDEQPCKGCDHCSKKPEAASSPEPSPTGFEWAKSNIFAGGLGTSGEDDDGEDEGEDDEDEPFTIQEAELPLTSNFARFRAYLEDLIPDLTELQMQQFFASYMQGALDAIQLVQYGLIMEVPNGRINRGYSLAELEFEAEDNLGLHDEDDDEDDEENEISDVTRALLTKTFRH